MTLTKASSNNRAHPLKSVAGDDGHNYYIINATGARGVANVHYLNYYSSLNEYGPEETGGQNPTGFFFVRDAASSGPDHYGDPTVKAGWAMYIFDVAKYERGVQNSGWVKIAQKGDVDWDVTDELKAMFVLKTVYNARVNDVDNRFEQDEAIVASLSKRVTIVETKIEEIYPLAHSHFYYDESGEKQGENLTVLNRLDDKYKCLYYRGKPIGGNSYIYDHVEYNEQLGHNEIVWCDPTIDETEWTHEVVKNSDEIAQKILATDIARVGLTLIVMEVDGALSIYKYVRSNERNHGVYDFDNKKVIFDPTAWHPSDWANLPLYTRFYTREISTTPGAEWSDWEYKGYYHPELAEAGDLGAIAVKNLLAAAYEESGTTIVGGSTQIAYVVPEVKLTYKFAQTCIPSDIGLAEYVATLPTASKWYYKRGAFVPLQFDGEHVVGHLHECIEETVAESGYVDASWEVRDSTKTYYQEDASGNIVVQTTIVVKHKGSGTEEYICGAVQQGGKPILREADPTKTVLRYRWVDLQTEGGTVATVGAAPIISYAEEATVWKDVYIYWKDPTDNTEAAWSKTVLVRKVGSAPEDVLDGIQVVTTVGDADRDKYLNTPFHDVIPFSDTPTYYRLFSVATSGSNYTASAAFTVEKMDWTNLLSIIRAGYASKILHTAEYYVSTDTVAQKDSTWDLPYYYTYDDVEEMYNPYIVSKGTTLPTGTTYYQLNEPSHLVLPTHDVYGDIECEVIGIGRDTDVSGTDRNCVLLMACKTVCQKFVDAIELKYSSSISEDTTKVSYKKYFKKTGSVYEDKTSATTNPHADGFYELNPEYSDSFSAGRGSNGGVYGSVTSTMVHNVGTTNIHQWLNSTDAAGEWYSAQTPFDQGEYTAGGTTYSYLSEAGFFGGFSDTSMFLTMSAYEKADTYTYIPACKVSLPAAVCWYWNNILHRKTTGRFAANTSWATFFGAPKLTTEADSKRTFSGFYDGKTKREATKTAVAPDVVTNILPIFMIG